jgi:PAS domain S-box-containing protein
MQPGGDEIGQLAEAFDRMASALDEREAELLKSDESLRQSEANYRLLFEATPLAAGVYDTASLRFLAVNAMAERIYGYTREELLELTVLDLFLPADRAEVHRWLAEMTPETVGPHIWTHRRKDGSCLQVEAVSHFLEFNGRPARLALAMDVTERLQAAESLRDSRDQLRNLANRLQLVREEERTGIAREIHDELGQALTGLKMDLSWLRGRAAQLDGAPEAAGLLARLERMSALTDETVQTVRRIATELRPAVLDALGLVAALEWQSKDFQARSGIPCAFTTGIEEMRLSPECATAVFRIFQEALTNIARHANATSVTARLECVENRICLWIQDDGVGIAPEVAANSRSLGLLGLRERAHVIGADLSIAGRPGEGTRVSLTFPTRPRGCILSGTPCILRDRAGARYQCAMPAAATAAGVTAVGPARDGGAEE